MQLALHHVSIPTENLVRAIQFYEGVLGLKQVARPPFSSVGAWLGVGALQIHLIVYSAAHFRRDKNIDNDDVHFALRTEDFEDAYQLLRSHGYDEGLEGDDPKRMILKRTGLAGFAQLFVMDPDRNIIEINTAPYNT